ncbi:MAG: LamG domain-containing protein, partial [Clostridiales Family XIII bacterium]|jgi:hypothetical protein|nr:LamG domain-containing protein [Clostridiales Family XIII bacterium]
MVTEGGVRKADPKPSDRVRSRSIYFDGSGDYASMATSSGLLDLSPYDKVTVEVCFKEAVKDQVKMLYEFTENANLPVNTGGFFISTNQNGEDLYPGEIHSCTNNIGHTGTTAHGAKDFKWLNDPSKFCTITMQMSKVADDTGRLSFVDGVPAPFFMPTDREDLVDKATDDTNTIDEGDFAKANFYIGSRAGKESFFKGEIYSVRIYGRKLTDSEIQRNAEADRRRFGD